MTSEQNFMEKVLLAAKEIERLAFEMPPPNSYTPKFVMIAIALKELSKKMQRGDSYLPSKP